MIASTNSNVQLMDDASNVNLYALKPVQAALVDESSGLPPGIVMEIFDDLEGIYSEDLLQSGIIVHPQIVAAIAATVTESYVYALLSQDREVGASLVYGAVLLGQPAFQQRVFNMASSAFEPDIDLPVETLDLIEHAFEAAANLRERTTDDSEEKNVVNLSDRVTMHVEDAILFGHYQRPTTPAPHPTFDRFCEMFNQIREAVVEGRRVDDTFFRARSQALRTICARSTGRTSSTTVQFGSKPGNILKRSIQFSATGSSGRVSEGPHELEIASGSFFTNPI